MSFFDLKEREFIRNKLNTLSYNTRFVACSDGVITALIEQAQDQDIKADKLLDALDIFKHKNLEKMPRIPEIITEAISQMSKGGDKEEGCNKCGFIGIISVVKDNYESCGACTCSLGRFYNRKYNITRIGTMLDNGYVLTEISSINLEELKGYKDEHDYNSRATTSKHNVRDLIRRFRIQNIKI